MRAIALAIVLLALMYGDAHDANLENKKVTNWVCFWLFVACIFCVLVGV